MAVDTKWNVSELTSLMERLTEQKNIVEKNKDMLLNLNEEVETAWQGFAGRTFDQRMDIDAENMELFISQMNSLIDDLTRAIKECYEVYEGNIENEVNKLKNMIL